MADNAERDGKRFFEDLGVDGIIYLLKSFITTVCVILAYVYVVQTQSLSFVSHVGCCVYNVKVFSNPPVSVFFTVGLM